MSFHLPSFISKLADPKIKTILLCGCGGGFDFVHSLLIYSDLKKLGKKIIIGSYSFGDPGRIKGEFEVVFEQGMASVKRVTAKSTAASHYGPEVHICSFLDKKYPQQQPHFVYAYYARVFSVPILTKFYNQLQEEHNLDAIVLFDGGSDSLMAGDEEGLGDPIEDAVSVTTVAHLKKLKLKMLISVGLGADRFNQVSDCATLRAIAELTKEGGYWGCLGLEPNHPGFLFYRDCIDHIYQNQTFNSVIAGTIIAATEGNFGSQEIHPLLINRIEKGELFLWPLMAMLWAFDVEKMAKRSFVSDWICECETPEQCYAALYMGRDNLKEIKGVENLPKHEDMRYDESKNSGWKALAKMLSKKKD